MGLGGSAEPPRSAAPLAAERPLTERPLADRMRPRSIADIVGQPQVLGPGKPLRVAYNVETQVAIGQMRYYAGWPDK